MLLCSQSLEMLFIYSHFNRLVVLILYQRPMKYWVGVVKVNVVTEEKFLTSWKFVNNFCCCLKQNEVSEWYLIII